MAKTNKGAKGKKAGCRTGLVKPEHREYLEYHAKLSGIPTQETVDQIVEDWLDAGYVIDIGRLEKAKGLPSTLVPSA